MNKDRAYDRDDTHNKSDLQSYDSDRGDINKDRLYDGDNTRDAGQLPGIDKDRRYDSDQSVESGSIGGLHVSSIGYGSYGGHSQ